MYYVLIFQMLNIRNEWFYIFRNVIKSIIRNIKKETKEIINEQKLSNILK